MEASTPASEALELPQGQVICHRGSVVWDLPKIGSFVCSPP